MKAQYFPVEAPCQIKPFQQHNIVPDKTCFTKSLQIIFDASSNFPILPTNSQINTAFIGQASSTCPIYQQCMQLTKSPLSGTLKCHLSYFNRTMVRDSKYSAVRGSRYQRQPLIQHLQTCVS